jgi:hypothetical protein
VRGQANGREGADRDGEPVAGAVDEAVLLRRREVEGQADGHLRVLPPRRRMSPAARRRFKPPPAAGLGVRSVERPGRDERVSGGELGAAGAIEQARRGRWSGGQWGRSDGGRPPARAVGGGRRPGP